MKEIPKPGTFRYWRRRYRSTVVDELRTLRRIAPVDDVNRDPTRGGKTVVCRLIWHSEILSNGLDWEGDVAMTEDVPL